MLRTGHTKRQAHLAVFLMSAAFHELLVSVPLGMFRIWAFTAMLLQMPLAIFTERYVKGTVLGNMIMWASLVLGQPIAIFMYVHDYVILQHAIHMATLS